MSCVACTHTHLSTNAVLSILLLVNILSILFYELEIFFMDILLAYNGTEIPKNNQHVLIVYPSCKKPKKKEMQMTFTRELEIVCSIWQTIRSAFNTHNRLYVLF